MTEDHAIIPVERIERSILLLRGQRVMLDSDLAELYGVTTKRLNEQVRRNLDRFPADFMFVLSGEEFARLRSHFATSKPGRGGRRTLPCAFSEHGAVMLASVLSTRRAIEVSVLVVRAFVSMRRALAGHAELARKLAELEAKLGSHDTQIAALLEAIKRLMAPPAPPRRKVGFMVKERMGGYAPLTRPDDAEV